MRASAQTPVYPSATLERPTDVVNDYETKHIMQMCFPALFSDACGGITAFEAEGREHEYDLAEFCAHLMRWHDRRFVIHRYFKFYCLNLIQRRQIDGLVRRVAVHNCVGHQLHGTRGVQEEVRIEDLKNITDEGQLSKAGRRLLNELKPFFQGRPWEWTILVQCAR